MWYVIIDCCCGFIVTWLNFTPIKRQFCGPCFSAKRTGFLKMVSYFLSDGTQNFNYRRKTITNDEIFSNFTEASSI